MAEAGFWERLNPVTELRNRIQGFRSHPIQSAISTALGFVNPALGLASRAAFGAYNSRHPQVHQFVRPALNGPGFGSVGFSNYGAAPSGADVDVGYEDYGSLFTGEPNAPGNYVEIPKGVKELGQFGGRGWEGIARGQAAGEMGVIGRGAGGETLIRGLTPFGTAVYNKRKNNNS